MLTPALAVLVLQVAAPLARDVDPARHVLVLVNEAVPESVALGEAYRRARGVPADNVCRVRTTADEVIAWPAFQAEVLAPVRAFLARHPDAVYLVPTWGVPVKVAEHVKDDLPPDADPMRRHVTSVDAAAVDRELELARGDLPARPGWVESRTWRLERSVTADDGVLVVMRLDGPTPEQARALIDLALHGELYGVEGAHLLDTRGLTGAGDGYATYDAELRQVAGVFARHGLPLRHDDQGPVVDLSTIEGGPGHYWGWYTGTLEAAAPFRFAPGAVACHVHSFSADTIRHPGRNWVGPLLDRGATVAIGTVYEPLTAGFPTAPLFWERFLAGHTVGQALQLSNRFTSWMAVYVGDPLYAPYAAQARAAQAEHRPLVTGAAARLEALLDQGDLDGAAALVARLDALPVRYRGGEGGGLRMLAREVRARRGARSGEGTVAALRAAVAAADDALARGEWATAQREAQRALGVSPGSYEGNLALGRALLGLGKDATGPLERAAALEPDEPEVLGALCRALLARGRAEAALAAARRAGLPHLEGEALVALERWDEALARLEAARAARPRDRRLALAHGRALLGARRAPAAVEALRRALDELPVTAAELEEYEALVALWAEAAALAKTDGAARAAEVARALRRLKPPPRRAAQKLIDEAEALLERGGGDLGPPPAVDAPGLPRARLSSRRPAAVRVLLLGPVVVAHDLPRHRGSGEPRPVDLELPPGVYRVVVVEGAQVRTATLEARLDRQARLALGAELAWEP